MKRHVLAVDDSPSMRDMLAFTISSGGYAVTTAEDGLAALDALKHQSADIIITDLNMPRLDGLGLIRKLRESAQYRSTPVLLLTTETSDTMKQAGRSAGATGWISKPFEPEALLSLLTRLLQ